MRIPHAVLAGLLALALFGAPATDAQICLDFVSFCDGLELNFDGDVITGWWRNATGCDGEDMPVAGLIADLPRVPCPPGNSLERDNPQGRGRAIVACVPEIDCNLLNDEWYFVFDRMDGTVDLGHVELSLPPPGACWNDEIEYDLLLGPCPLFAPGVGKSLLSTVQVGR